MISCKAPQAVELAVNAGLSVSGDAKELRKNAILAFTIMQAKGYI